MVMIPASYVFSPPPPPITHAPDRKRGAGSVSRNWERRGEESRVRERREGGGEGKKNLKKRGDGK